MDPRRHPLPFPFLSSPATLSSPVLASLLSIPGLPSPPPSPIGPSPPPPITLARQRCCTTAYPRGGARRPAAAPPHAVGQGATAASIGRPAQGATAASIGGVTRRRGTPAAAAGSRGRSPASIRRHAHGPGQRRRRRPMRRPTATTRRRRRLSATHHPRRAGQQLRGRCRECPPEVHVHQDALPRTTVGGGQEEHVDVRVLTGGVGGELVATGDADGRRRAGSRADAREKPMASQSNPSHNMKNNMKNYEPDEVTKRVVRSCLQQRAMTYA
ncbi:hypothetical protein PAHAL_3G047700 [Panicum hallii]|uniref:Uncharacterized protein n=1 Tax=Panicum hallii TaxID=206008 RepID=A0A2T8KH57_9POAL|nr:hypothetical protein PAHAL_3G047700 [Panicum hallii]